MLHVLVCLILHAKVPFALVLSFCLTWKMRLLTLEMVITSDLDFFEGLVQLMDIPVGSSCSKSLAVPDGDIICVVCSQIPSELGNKEVLGDVSLCSFV